MPLQVFATIGKFGLSPTTPTVIQVPSNRTAIVQYEVTNQTPITRTLTMVPITGVTQQTGPGLCSSPFTLASQETCLLNLVVDGSQLLSPVNGGPVLCKTKAGTSLPDSLLCSQPSNAFQLMISPEPAVSALAEPVYVTNWNAKSISLCSSSGTGSLENCNIAATNGLFLNPEAIATNVDVTHLYVANIGGGVSLCQLNNQGTISGCSNTGSGFNGPDGIALNSAGTSAYVSNVTSNSVTLCGVDVGSGELSGCSSTGGNFSGPSDITLHPTLPIAYITNFLGDSVTRCVIGVNDELTCGAPLAGFNKPEGITLSPSGVFAYITNNGDGTVSYCAVDPTTGLLSNCTTTASGTFAGFGNLAFNNAGTLAYIPSSTTTVSVCSVAVNGDLQNCVDSNGSGFSNPSGLLVTTAH